MKGLLHLDTVRLAKCTYEQNAAIYADSLVNGLIGDSFDAIAAIPTSDRKAQEPYFRSIEDRWPGIMDLSPFLIRSASSTGGVPCEQRLDATTFQPPTNVQSKTEILLVDDVLDSGVSAAAVIRAIKRVWREVTPTFTICCPLWITHQR
jgi:predicted amidophosphoribosyltransferase